MPKCKICKKGNSMGNGGLLCRCSAGYKSIQETLNAFGAGPYVSREVLRDVEELEKRLSWQSGLPLEDGKYLVDKDSGPEVVEFTKDTLDNNWTDTNGYPLSNEAIKGWIVIPECIVRINRYEIYKSINGNMTPSALKSSDGDWCRYEDVVKLEAQNKVLVELVGDILRCNEFCTAEERKELNEDGDCGQ